jgi:general secretion pathway protein L
MSILRIRVSRETPVTGAFEWARYDEAGVLLDKGDASLQQSAPGVSGACELVVAAELVSLGRIDTPAAQRERLSTALRYLVEDLAATDPERLHVAAESEPGKDSLGVGIVDREWLARTLARIEQTGLEARAAYPECLLTPLHRNAWTMIWNGAGGFVRSGPVDGFSLDSTDGSDVPVALSLALERARAEARVPERLVVRTAAGTTPPALERWSETLGVAIESGPEWQWHGRGSLRRPPLDLLQGEFAQRRGQQDWIARLRRPAIFAAALVVLASLGIAVDWNAKVRERNRLVAEMRSIYRQSFGERAVVVDAPLQMQRALAALRARSGQLAPSDFLALLGALRSSAVDPATQQIESIEYERGILTVTLRARNATQTNATLEELRAKTAPSGLEIRADQVGSGADLRIRLTARARGA